MRVPSSAALADRTTGLSDNQVLVRGDVWTFRVKDLKGDAAISHITDKRIDFDPEHVNHATVVHELFHAYCSYLYVESSALSVEHFEEIVADMLGASIRTLMKQANRALKTLKIMADEYDSKRS